MLEILVATKNPGKITELSELLRGIPVRLRGLNEFENVVEPEETGRTFMENAQLKASYYSRLTGLTALADDSGLEVRALGGAPGVLSARYAGRSATDSDRIAKLLKELAAIRGNDRAARFVCAMAVAEGDGKVAFSAEGVCRGRIVSIPRGRNGFGYDPVFAPEGYEETFGELPSGIKQKISHRAQAIEKIIRFLGDYTLS